MNSKYIFLILSGVLGVILNFYQERAYRKPEKKRRQSLVRRVLIVASVLFIVLGVYFVRVDDRASFAYQNEQRVRINTLSNEVAMARSALSQANTNLTLQARSIGSLVFNVETSDEGKRKFMEEFRKFSMMVDPSHDTLSIQELFCPDGLAVYLFARKTEELTGFRFYTNAEINEALSGVDITAAFMSGQGNRVLPTESTVSKAIRKMTIEETPAYGVNAIERELSRNKMRSLLDSVCRYVYRANGISFNAPLPDGSQVLAFTYHANPNNEKYFQTVEVRFSDGEMRSLYGIKMTDFIKRFLSMMKARGVEPKVTSNDIGALRNHSVYRKRKEGSPFKFRGDL